uniref:Uncharacterized protein n=1 Tax=Clastoptera arizonana TaxID=38151 RepID=A0A1B6BYC7_9HEMI
MSLESSNRKRKIETGREKECFGDHPAVSSLERNEGAFKQMQKQISDLQNNLIEKNEAIKILQTELETYREVSNLDATSGPIPFSQMFEMKIITLEHEIKSRDTHIKMLSDNLQQKIQECEELSRKEKSRLFQVESLNDKLNNASKIIEETRKKQKEEIANLQSKVTHMTASIQENVALVNDLKKTLEKKDNALRRKDEDLQATTIELRALKEKAVKVSHMTASIQENVALVNDLKKTLEKKDNALRRKDEDLQATTIELRALKEKAVKVFSTVENITEIKELASSKEKQLEEEAKKQLVILRSSMDEMYIQKLKQVELELIQKHEEEKKKLGQMHDDRLRTCLKNHEMELRTKNANMVAEVKTYKMACEAQMTAHRECMDSLVEQLQEDSRRLEEDFEKQLENCHKEIKLYEQKVQEYEKRLSEEVKKASKKCHCVYGKELLEMKCTQKNMSSTPEEEIDKLVKNLNELTTSEAKKEVELDTYKKELRRSNKELESYKYELEIGKKMVYELRENLKKREMELEKQTEIVSSREGKENELETCKLELNKTKEEMNELANTLNEKQIEIDKLRKNLKELKSFEERKEDELTSCKSELNRTKDTMESMKNLDNMKIIELSKKIELLENSLVESNKRREVELQKCNMDGQKKSNEFHGEEILKLKNSIEKNNEQISELTFKLKESSVKKLELLNDLEKFNNIIKHNEKEKHELQTKIEKLEKEKEIGRKQHLDKIVMLKNEFKMEKKSKEDILIEYTQEIKEIHSQLVCIKDFNDVSSESDSEHGSNETVNLLKLLIKRSNNLLKNYDKKLIEARSSFNDSISAHEEEISCLEMKLNQMSKYKNDFVMEMYGHKKYLNDLKNELYSLINNCEKINDIKSDSEMSDSADFCDKIRDQLHVSRQEVSQVVSLLKSFHQNIEKEYSSQSKQLCNQTYEGQRTNTCLNKDDLDLEEYIGPCLKSNNLKQSNAFKGIATSTPNVQSDICRLDVDQIMHESSTTPKKYKLKDKQIEDRLISIHWLNECRRLEKENKSLEKTVEKLQYTNIEMEHCMDITYNEISQLETRSKNLQEQIEKMEQCQQLVDSLEHQNKQYRIKIEKLEKEHADLKIDYNTAIDDRLMLERENNKMINSINQKVPSLGLETILNSLQQKSQEVILLREDILIRYHDFNSLKTQFEKITDSLNDAMYKLKETKKDLKYARNKLNEAYKDKEEIMLRNRSLEKEIVLLKAKWKNVDSNKEKCCSFGLGLQNFIEEFQQDLILLKKQSVLESAMIEQIHWEKLDGSGDSEQKQLGLLIENNIQLSKQKEELIKYLEQQQNILTSLEAEGKFSTDLSNLHDVQTKLIADLQIHLDQHSQLLLAVKDVEKLHKDNISLTNQLSLKVKEKNVMEEQLEEERGALKNMMIKLESLEAQISLKEDIIQDLKTDAVKMMDHLVTAETKLYETENKITNLNKTMYETQIQYKNQQLDYRTAQLEQNYQIQFLKEPPTRTSLCKTRFELEQENNAVHAHFQKLTKIQCNDIALKLNQNFKIKEQHYQDQV